MKVQKQHGEHPARKMWLRRAVLAEIGDGAAYVPFIGDGDIPVACYSDRAIAGVDLDPARVAVARIALPSATIIVGDCDEGWPFPGVGSPRHQQSWKPGRRNAASTNASEPRLQSARN